MDSNIKKSPTQMDVARIANVSQAMVSYVLNGKESVMISPETRQRVLDAIEQLGYQPNRTARSLRTSKSFTIAVIIPDITNPFYPAFARGIQDIADQQDYDVITYNTDGIREKEHKFLQSVMQRQVDGIIAVLFHTNARELFPILDMNIPIVRLEAAFKDAGERPLDNLYLDNAEAAQGAVQYLIEAGHRQIGMLSSHEGPAHYRASGYRNALFANGFPLSDKLIRVDDFNERGGYNAMQALLDNNPALSAVFAANDLMAMGAYLAVKEAGLSIPGDIAIIGFDNIPTANLVTPALTTVDQFQEQVGRRAAEMLLERVTGDAPGHGRSEKQPYQLIIRESA
jgi:LacI family transcriptional regulator